MTESLTVQHRALLELVKLGVGTSFRTDFDFSSLTPDMWWALFEESRAQALQLACFNGVGAVKNTVPPEVYKKWFAVATASLAANERVLDVQSALTQLLEKNDLPHVIIKGYASSFYYPDYEKRNFGDVDFLVEHSQLDEVEQILLADGYVKRIDEHLFHRVYTKDDAHIEMHFEPAGVPEGAAGKLIRGYLKGAVHKYTRGTDPVFHNPLPEIHAVVILLHDLHHMMGHGMGLRHLCDWAMFVNKTCDDSFWESDVLPLLRQTGLLKFAAIITKTSALYLGTRCPDWAADIDNEVCLMVMSDIFSLGNFGTKNEERAYSGYFISNHGKSGTKNNKIVSLAKTLRDTMLSTYPILRKCIILYPFIFVWRIIKYLILMLAGKKASLVKLNSYANERRKLYRKFELYKTTSPSDDN